MLQDANNLFNTGTALDLFYYMRYYNSAVYPQFCYPNPSQSERYFRKYKLFRLMSVYGISEDVFIHFSQGEYEWGGSWITCLIKFYYIFHIQNHQNPQGRTGGLSFGIRHSPAKGEFPGTTSQQQQSNVSYNGNGNEKTSTTTVTRYYTTECDPCQNVQQWKSSGGGGGTSYSYRVEPAHGTWNSGGGTQTHTITRTYETISS